MEATLARIVHWLVAGDFQTIEQHTGGIRLSAALLREAVKDYGRTLVMPPTPGLLMWDAIGIDGYEPRRWSVTVDLWTLEEGRSDLSLECTLIDRPGPFLGVEIDNLHVL